MKNADNTAPGRRRGVLAGASLAALGLVYAIAPRAVGADARPAGGSHAQSTQQRQLVERGRYLVAFGACNDCHTPLKLDPTTHQPEPDMSRLLSGHPEGAPDPTGRLGETDLAVIGGSFTAFRLPFGVVYSSNLTPDRETGLGSWTEAMFVRAMRTGKHMGGEGRPILPPMPWYGLAALTDQDAAAIFAYLRSVPAVRNGVPAPKVPEGALAGIDRQNRAMAARIKRPQ
jgi:mono/diheme cytochrome c family protein